MSRIHLTIDGKSLTAGDGQTILEVCRENGIYVPTLCHHQGLSSVGACRLCIVEIEGQRRPVTACTTPVSNGLVVTTATPRLHELRRQTVELLFAERNHICPFCPRSGNCELQKAGYHHGIDHVRYDYCFPTLPMDNSHPRIALDHNRCVLCTRCVRACDEWIGAHVLDLDNRGSLTMIIADNGIPLGESSCVSCGTCVSVCPTGALFEKRSAHWQGRLPLELTETICPGCGVGCRIHASVRHRQIGSIQSSGGPAGNHVLCQRGRFNLVDPHSARVEAIRIKQGNQWVVRPLHDAVSECIRRLNLAPIQADCNRVITLLSPRLPLETMGAAQSFLSRVVGSSRWTVLDRSNPISIREAFNLKGLLAPLAGLKDLEESDMILLVGCNLERWHGVVASYVRRLVLHRRAKLAKINPRHTWLTGWTDRNLEILPGKDPIVLAALLKYLIDAGAVNAPIPPELTKKLGELDDASISMSTGVEGTEIKAIAQMYAEARRPMIICGTGLTRNGREALQASLNIVRATGRKTDSGRWRLMELAAGANSAGSRLLGAAELSFEKLIPHSADMAFVVLGDDEWEWPANWISKLRAVGYVVALAAREHPVTEIAQVVIPTASWAERNGTFVNLEGRVQKAHRLMKPAAGVIDEADFFQTLAKAWRGSDCGWKPPGLPGSIAHIGDGQMAPCEPHQEEVDWYGLQELASD